MMGPKHSLIALGSQKRDAAIMFEAIEVIGDAKIMKWQSLLVRTNTFQSPTNALHQCFIWNSKSKSIGLKPANPHIMPSHPQ